MYVLGRGLWVFTQQPRRGSLLASARALGLLPRVPPQLCLLWTGGGGGVSWDGVCVRAPHLSLVYIPVGGALCLFTLDPNRGVVRHRWCAYTPPDLRLQPFGHYVQLGKQPAGGVGGRHSLYIYMPPPPPCRFGAGMVIFPLSYRLFLCFVSACLGRDRAGQSRAAGQGYRACKP